MRLAVKCIKRNNVISGSKKILVRFNHHRKQIIWRVKEKSKLYYNFLEYNIWEADDLDLDVVNQISWWLQTEGFRVTLLPKELARHQIDITWG